MRPAPDREAATRSRFAGTFFDGAWPWVVGHRGNPVAHPDNSLAGVMSGLGVMGAVEVDVRLTRDGHLLLAHDPELGGGAIAATDAAELLALQPRPCLLDEILALPGRVDLEIKGFPGEEGFDPEGRTALLAASRARPTDLITSFYWPHMDLLRERDVAALTGLVVGEGASVADALAHAADHGHGAVAAHETLLSGGVCQEAARREVALVAWTVDSPDRARELSGMGVAAIISDDPLLIYNGLQE